MVEIPICSETHCNRLMAFLVLRLTKLEVCNFEIIWTKNPKRVDILWACNTIDKYVLSVQRKSGENFYGTLTASVHYILYLRNVLVIPRKLSIFFSYIFSTVRENRRWKSNKYLVYGDVYAIVFSFFLLFLLYNVRTSEISPPAVARIRREFSIS